MNVDDLALHPEVTDDLFHPSGPLLEDILGKNLTLPLRRLSEQLDGRELISSALIARLKCPLVKRERNHLRHLAGCCRNNVFQNGGRRFSGRYLTLSNGGRLSHRLCGYELATEQGQVSHIDILSRIVGHCLAQIGFYDIRRSRLLRF